MRLLLASCLDQSIDKVKHLLGPDLSTVRVVCIPTAGNVYLPEKLEWQRDEMRSLQELGVRWSACDLAGKSQAEVAAALAEADVIYVTGGNTYYLLDQMQKCDFAGALAPRLVAGALYIGCSAGAGVACPDITHVGEMDDRAKSDIRDLSALGLIDFWVMPHIDHPKYGPQARAALRNLGKQAVALRDDQALYYERGVIEVF